MRITFGLQDYVPETNAHYDAIVITVMLANLVVRRVLVHTGSAVDIIFMKASEELQIDASQIVPVTVPLVGFMGEAVKTHDNME
ncbi:hypothetical protein DH2020_040691 [Rehmannia glutinosa]|uniref:Uncharacterized protein n=1 Tax=Rehmannia glutinosa TaxID=99300 RepID=A0ABR0US79_REHGL